MFDGPSGSQVTFAILATPGTTVGIIMVSACRGQLPPAGNVSGRRKTKGARDGKRLSFGRRNPAYAKLIVEVDQPDPSRLI